MSISSLFVANNNIAVACLVCFKEMNIRIPQDVALVSFDDIDAFKLSYPTITAVSQPVEEMGKQSVKMLIKSIESEGKTKAKEIILPTQLELRRSCGSFISEL